MNSCAQCVICLYTVYTKRRLTPVGDRRMAICVFELPYGINVSTKGWLENCMGVLVPAVAQDPRDQAATRTHHALTVDLSAVHTGYRGGGLSGGAADRANGLNKHMRTHNTLEHGRGPRAAVRFGVCWSAEAWGCLALHAAPSHKKLHAYIPLENPPAAEAAGA